MIKHVKKSSIYLEGPEALEKFKRGMESTLQGAQDSD
jgi:hypothetical protein